MRKIDDSLQYCLIRWGEARAKQVAGLAFRVNVMDGVYSPAFAPMVPVYTSDPVAVRTDIAFCQLESELQPVLVIRYELCLPEEKARKALNLHSRDAYRWQLEKSVRAIGRIMKKPVYASSA